MSAPDNTTKSSFEALLSATAAGDYEQFVAVGDERFRRGITPAMFQPVSQSLAPRMRRGYTSTYLGQLREQGAQISLWRLAFADDGDDRLARMSVRQGRVNGFLITPAFS